MKEWNPSGSYPFNWFREYAMPIFERLLVPHLGGVKNYLELGIAHGLSLRWALENVLAGKDGAVAVAVDPYFPARSFGDHPREAAERKQIMLDNLRLWGGEGKGNWHANGSEYHWFINDGAECQIHIDTSENFLLQCKPDVFDWIYVDANHNATEALTDLVLSWRALKVGGIMVVDDIDQKYRGNRPRAWHACRAWEDCYEGFYDVLFKHSRMYAYRKIERRRKGEPPTLVIGEPIAPGK
jgi:hypothetical protein